jgi:glycosyltransferase involved in cell wall biosynthesis
MALTDKGDAIATTSIGKIADSVSPLIHETAVEQIRVCHVSMTLQTGGLERLLVDFGRYRNEGRFDVQFAALAELGAPADDIRDLGLPVESVADSASGRLGRLKHLAMLFRQSQIQVVHTHNTLAHFYGAFAARLAGVPVVINTQHGRGCGSSLKARLQFRMANRLTDRIVGVSEDAVSLCRRDDAHSADRMSAIWNGIDVDRFDYRGPASHPTAISVARLSKEKDFATLLRAVWIVIKERPDFRLKIVGDGGERASLQALCDELKLNNNVEFLGERHDVPELLKQSAFFLSSTTTEGVSLTLLEAMAVGLPVITTNVGGNPEVVLDGGSGRLVQPGRPEELAWAMRDLLNDVDTWPVMGQLGRERVERHFNVRNVVRHYEDLYLEVLREKNVITT